MKLCNQHRQRNVYTKVNLHFNELDVGTTRTHPQSREVNIVQTSCSAVSRHSYGVVGLLQLERGHVLDFPKVNGFTVSVHIVYLLLQRVSLATNTGNFSSSETRNMLRKLAPPTLPKKTKFEKFTFLNNFLLCSRQHAQNNALIVHAFSYFYLHIVLPIT